MTVGPHDAANTTFCAGRLRRRRLAHYGSRRAIRDDGRRIICFKAAEDPHPVQYCLNPDFRGDGRRSLTFHDVPRGDLPVQITYEWRRRRCYACGDVDVVEEVSGPVSGRRMTERLFNHIIRLSRPTTFAEVSRRGDRGRSGRGYSLDVLRFELVVDVGAIALPYGLGDVGYRGGETKTDAGANPQGIVVADRAAFARCSSRCSSTTTGSKPMPEPRTADQPSQR